MALRQVSKIALRDGRTLAWREYGAGANGTPVVFLHGNLNSRIFSPCWANTDSVTASANARVIAVDRPGYGESTTHPGRTYLDFSRDIDELANHLGLEQFAVCGYSSGGPHAIACATANIGNRIAAAGLISADAPYVAMGGGMRERMFGIDADTSVNMEWARQRALRNSESMKESYEQMRDPERRAIALLDLATATAQGLDGSASDAVLEASEWDFTLRPEPHGRSIGVEYHIWHGGDDKDVPISAAEYLKAELSVPATRAHFLSGENHTLIRRHWSNILESLVASVQREGSSPEETSNPAAKL